MVQAVEWIFQYLVRLTFDGAAAECAPLIPGDIGSAARGDVPISWNVIEDLNKWWIRKHCNGNGGRIHTSHSVALVHHVSDVKVPWRIDEGRVKKRSKDAIA